jgi:hypothetical protein
MIQIGILMLMIEGNKCKMLMLIRGLTKTPDNTNINDTIMRIVPTFEKIFNMIFVRRLSTYQSCIFFRFWLGVGGYNPNNISHNRSNTG